MEVPDILHYNFIIANNCTVIDMLYYYKLLHKYMPYKLAILYKYDITQF